MDKFSHKRLEVLNPFIVKKTTEVAYFLKETICVFAEAVVAYFPEANQTFWYILSKCHNSTENHLSSRSWSNSWDCLLADIVKTPELGGSLGRMRDFNIHLEKLMKKFTTWGQSLMLLNIKY